MITTTARQIAEAALKTLGVLGDGRTLSAEEGTDALERLNQLVDALGTQRQTIYTITRATYPLIANTGTYTLGVGADFDQARPLWIASAGYLSPGSSPAQETKIPVISDQQYQLEVIKGLTSAEPTWVYYNPTNTTGWGTLTYWPIPNQNLTVVLYMPTAVDQFPNWTTETLLPPGWARMFRYNLAVELIPEYGQVDPRIAQLVVQQADATLRDVKRANYRLADLSIDPAFTGGPAGIYNIYSDQ